MIAMHFKLVFMLLVIIVMNSWRKMDSNVERLYDSCYNEVILILNLMEVSTNMDSMTESAAHAPGFSREEEVNTMTTVKNNDDPIIETSEYRKHDDTRWMTAVIIIATIIALIAGFIIIMPYLNGWFHGIITSLEAFGSWIMMNAWNIVFAIFGLLMLVPLVLHMIAVGVWKNDNTVNRFLLMIQMILIAMLLVIIALHHGFSVYSFIIGMIPAASIMCLLMPSYFEGN